MRFRTVAMADCSFGSGGGPYVGYGLACKDWLSCSEFAVDACCSFEEAGAGEGCEDDSRARSGRSVSWYRIQNHVPPSGHLMAYGQSVLVCSVMASAVGASDRPGDHAVLRYK